MKLKWLAEPLLSFLCARLLLRGLLLRFADFGKKVVEFRHGLVLSMLCILHLVNEFLSLQLHSAEFGLDVDIALVEVRSHLVLLESEQTGP